MLDIKWVREHYDEVAEMLASRNNSFPLDRYKELDEERRAVLLEVEKLKERRNSGSKLVGSKKKAGEDTTELQNEIRELGEEIKKSDDKANAIQAELDALALSIPNMPDATVP
ncbi:MAG: serine--tRNA ligase, partial [Synergistes sp.]|nr:serine--tRNA ligase [Synergistes sp.]